MITNSAKPTHAVINPDDTVVLYVAGALSTTVADTVGEYELGNFELSPNAITVDYDSFAKLDAELALEGEAFTILS